MLSPPEFPKCFTALLPHSCHSASHTGTTAPERLDSEPHWVSHKANLTRTAKSHTARNMFSRSSLHELTRKISSTYGTAASERKSTRQPLPLPLQRFISICITTSITRKDLRGTSDTESLRCISRKSSCLSSQQPETNKSQTVEGHGA